MGVHLGELAIKHHITLSSLSGKSLAIDAFNMLYQFLSSIRQEDGTPLMDFKGNVTAHLSGLFYRNARLLENGIRPIYVFDGKAPAFKHKTRIARDEIKSAAQIKWKQALEEERFVDARKYAQATSKLTPEMIAESKELLAAMGIPCVQAPSEGEAQAGYMVQKGMAYAAASQDYDALLFGSPLLVRNLSITGKRKVPRENRFVIVEPEEINLPETLTALGLTREQLVLLGIMVGNDFNEGVYRVGPKTAYKIVKEHNTLSSMMAYVKEKYNHEFAEDLDAVYAFFMNPHCEEVPAPKWQDADAAALKKLLCDKHDFSEERISHTIESMQKSFKDKNSQSRLENWF